MQSQINELPQVMTNDSDAEIACIFFAYANYDLIKALQKRGTNLTNGKIKEILKSEEEINQLIKKKGD